MALVSIGNITSTNVVQTYYPAVFNSDNVVKQNFYQLKIGFSVTADPLTSTNVVQTYYPADFNSDNVVKKNFYPLKIGFTVTADPSALPNETFRRLPNYVYWS